MLFLSLFVVPRFRSDPALPPSQTFSRAYQNAKENTASNARIEKDKALQKVMTAMFKDDAQFFKQIQNNESFRRWLANTIFGLTNEGVARVSKQTPC